MNTKKTNCLLDPFKLLIGFAGPARFKDSLGSVEDVLERLSNCFDSRTFLTLELELEVKAVNFAFDFIFFAAANRFKLLLFLRN